MGGVFDPIHIGHLIAAQEALERFSLERVIFIPSGRPPHKRGRIVASPADRYIMAELAIEDNPDFFISDIEVNGESVNYTVDTMSKLRSEFPDDDFFFITGADAMMDILTWKSPARLLKMCTLIAATRPGYPISRLKTVLDRLEAADEVEIMKIPHIAISSTEIRRRVRKGASIRYLVPSSVREYIMKNRLYF